MTEQLKQQIRDYFERHRAQMVEDIKTLVRIPSVRGEATAAYPFGEMPYRALEAALKLAEQRGFAVQTYDNCIGTAELAAGEDRLDILAHLDVVPAADNWTVCPPFEPVERDGKLYGRGVADDKGPAVAALYAMACVRELGIPLKKNVRLVLGTDEECGSEDLPHYYDKVAEAPMTFSPDADFPVINIEKGRYVGNFSVDWVERTDEIRLVWFRSGVKTNVIPSEAECLIAGLDAAKVAEFCTSMEKTVGGSLTVSKTEEGVKIVCRTAGGHAAYPQGGCNAMTALLEVVGQMPLVGSDAWFGAVMLNKLFPHGDWTGAKINIAMEDESGPLTVVPTMVELDGAGVSGCFDIRYPLCGSEKKIYEQADPYFKDAGLLLETISVSEPHYVPADTPLVQTLLRAYTEWTGQAGEALAIGGGTYVHDLKRGVAFGCAMPGVDNRIHGFDEFADIDDLILSAEIFTQAIVELCG